MALNPLYTAAGHKTESKDYPKLPAIVFRAVGDKFQGTVKEVSDSFEMEETYGTGDKAVTKKVTKQVITYTNVTVINKKVDDDGEVTEERTEYPEANFWYSKVAQFEALGAGLQEVGKDDMSEVVGAVHQFKRITDGTAKQLRDGTMGSKPHRFLSKLTV